MAGVRVGDDRGVLAAGRRGAQAGGRVAVLDARTRDHIRWSIDAQRRRQLGAELDVDGRTDMQMTSHGAKALEAWEATGGDPLAALGFALDVLEGRKAAA